MSHRLTEQAHRMAQRGATRETAGAHASAMFPTRGKRTDAKVARLVDRYLNGRRKKA